jgi:hypothetical protein
VILIVAGILFLFPTLGAVSWEVPLLLLPLWPLLLIATGLHLIIGKRERWIPALIWTGALAVGAAYLAVNGFQYYGDLAHTSLSANLDGATSAQVRIESDQVTLNVDGNLDAAASSNLAWADLEYYTGLGRPTQSTGKSGDQATLDIVQRGSRMAFFDAGRRSPVWSIHLNPGVPTDLNVKAGAGGSTLDLQKLKVSRLSFAVGAGNAAITLPTEAGNMSASIDGGVGNLDVFVPAGVEARIRVDTGIGNASVDSRFVKSGDTYTSKGFDGAANKVDVTIHAGIGNVNVISK